MRILRNVFAIIIMTLLMVFLLIIGALFVLLNGPSENARKLFTLSCYETSAMKWLPKVFISEEEYLEITNPEEAKRQKEQEEKKRAFEMQMANGESIVIHLDERGIRVKNYDVDDLRNMEILPVASRGDTPGEASGEVSEDQNQPDLELVDINGGTYKGKLLIVKDPSRVQIASLDSFGGSGKTLSQFLEIYDAIACTNAGGFEDEGGKGNGGTPDGLVIRDGRITYGSAGGFYKDVVGFDANHVLHVGNMSGQEALNQGIVSGTSFETGPVLIKDGVRQTGFVSGINPRTAIGQREDGTVLMIAIEGRMIDSLGATFEDLCDIFLEYGAVNAGNLDGGSSSGMYYEGERITRSSSVIGDRALPTAVVVAR